MSRIGSSLKHIDTTDAEGRAFPAQQFDHSYRDRIRTSR